MALMKIDQAGLSAGVAGRARNDGLSDGSLVTLTDMTPGGSTLFELLWAHPEDTTSVLSLAPTVDPHVWTFSPTEAVGVGYGFRIRLTHTTNIGVVTTQTRIFGIPDGLGVVKPIPGERSDPNATIANATDSAVIARCERNWPTTGYPLGNPFGWGPELIELIESATGGLTAPQRNAIQAGDVPTDLNPFITISHLAKLGTSVISLTDQRFGWPGHATNIGPYLQAAIAYAIAHRIGTIELPAGLLICDRQIVVPPAPGPDGFNHAIMIRGQGREQTYIYFYNHTGGFRLEGTIDSSGMYYFGGGLRDLALVGVYDDGSPAGTHNGVEMFECIFTMLDNVHIRGFNGYGLFLDNIWPNGQQDLHFSNCHIQLNRAGGIWCNSVQQAVFSNMQINQNLGDGVTFTSGNNGIAWVGGLFQNEGRAMRFTRRDEPGDEQDGELAINMSMYGSVYVEQIDLDVPLFDFEEPAGSSEFNMFGSLVVQGGSLTTPVFRFEGNYAVVVAGKIHAAGWSKHIQAVNLAEFTGIGLQSGSDYYDFDTISQANATFIGRGGLCVGAAAPAGDRVALYKPLQLMELTTGHEPALKGVIYDTALNKLRFSPDGTLWYTLSVDPFNLAIDLAPYLAEFWDATSAADSGGALSAWVGSFHATPFTWSGTPPTVTTSAELNGQKVVKFSKASSMWVDTGTLTGGGILPGTSNDTPYAVTVLCRTPLGATSDLDVISQLSDANNDQLELKVWGNGAAADTFQTRVQDHIGGGGDSGNLAIGNVAPAGHMVEYMLSDYPTPGTVKNVITIDQGAPPAMNNFPSTKIGPITRVLLGNNLLGDATHPADVEVGLHLVCHTRPPASIRARFYQYIQQRFGIDIAGV
jgi:hypothetical protein